MRWRRPRPRPIQVVALAGSVLAAGTVLMMFNRMSGFMGRTRAEPQLIATVDLRLGNTLLAADRGEAQARADIEAGLLQLQTFAPAEPQTRAEAAKTRQWKQRFGVTRLHKTEARTPVAEAYADGYNRVMLAEIERRHGRSALDELLHGQDRATTGEPRS
ncbi:hypothetical protein [Roseateles saccharophilus]|nr:hypothetical protein [Roseateles saccharophilus]MDG0834431.1 hypothetical protein [Roseateles saccharophilus]